MEKNKDEMFEQEAEIGQTETVEEMASEETMDEKGFEAEELEKETGINIKDLDDDRVLNSEITGEMQRKYIDYSMSVIVSRALPSVEDGMKPVHRRILYAMKLLGLEKGMTKKSARIVGDIIGKFHPHGDTAVYDAMVRMAQDFSLRYPLILGQGNFGSMDGDRAAAMRYTEAKLNKIAVELLQDIDKETVKFNPNFDNSLKEPELLPGKVPNLLINGSSGIAVGMATNIPPHNLNEVCDATIKLIDKPAIDTDELLEIVKGPDFPTGGQLVSENLKEIYENGKGGIVLRAKISTESGKTKDSIVVSEIPYQVNKADLVKDIAKLVSEKKLPDVSDIRDESSKGKVRIVIELKKGSDSKFTINRLYKNTKLQTRFDCNLIGLIGGVPQVLTLKKILMTYIDYRKKIITNRTEFGLKKAEARLHIVEGLQIALKNLNAVIELIKKSKGGTEALDGLIKKYKLTKKQAEAILEISLKQLTSMERDKLSKEEKELKAQIIELKNILDNVSEVLKLIKKDLNDLKKSYGDDRRTSVLKSVKELKEKDLVKKEDVVITITDKGYVKRMPFQAYKEQKRGGKGVIGADLSTGDFVKQILTCSTHDYLLLFTERGRVFWLKAYQVPQLQRYGKGQALVNLLNIKDDSVASVIAVKEFKDYLFMGTKKGQVKKMDLSLFSKPRSTGVRAINLPLDESDSLIGVGRIIEGQEVMLMTARGLAIRFNSDEVRSMGRSSYGVAGIKLNEKDEVVSLEIVDKEKKSETIFTITDRGYGKRSLVEDYRLTGRAGKGVINLKVNEKTGSVVNTVPVVDKDQVILTTTKGIVIKTPVKDVRVMGRATQGVKVIKLNVGDRVSDIAKLQREDEVEKEIEKNEK